MSDHHALPSTTPAGSCRRYGPRMAVRFRRPPRREWLPMLVGIVLAAAGWLALTASDSRLGWALVAVGAVLFYGTVVYWMLTATADD